MATIIHAGDCSTDCATCKLQCDCQDCRITRNASEIDWSNPDWDEIESIFEDRDPSEWL